MANLKIVGVYSGMYHPAVAAPVGWNQTSQNPPPCVVPGETWPKEELAWDMEV